MGTRPVRSPRLDPAASNRPLAASSAVLGQIACSDPCRKVRAFVGDVDYSRHMSRWDAPIATRLRAGGAAQHEYAVPDEVDDPFTGWTQARVGCYWSRPLPDGRIVHMSTWQRGGEDGYSLTINYHRAEYQDLPAALAAFERLENEARASNPKSETPTIADVRARVQGRCEYAELKADLAAADVDMEIATARRRKLSERMDALWSEEAAAAGYVGRLEGEWR